MKILVTGGTGSVGRRAVARLIRHGHEVKVIGRRAELERTAAACGRVPEHPARDTFEALQCALFLLNAVGTESCQISICPGRVDQWLAPFRRFWEPKFKSLAKEVARGKKKKRRK